MSLHNEPGMQAEAVEITRSIRTVDAIVFDYHGGRVPAQLKYKVLPGTRQIIAIEVRTDLNQPTILIRQAGNIDAHGGQAMLAEHLLQQVSELRLSLALTFRVPNARLVLFQCPFALLCIFVPVPLATQLRPIRQALPLPQRIVLCLALQLVKVL